jgi:WhiB family redox-sensing transcriptional regulator
MTLQPAVEFGLLAELLDDTDGGWQERALCAQTDPDAFFPERGGSTKDAKAICMACEVRSECLEYALIHRERFGIWGGLSERERRPLEKRAMAVAVDRLVA